MEPKKKNSLINHLNAVAAAILIFIAGIYVGQAPVFSGILQTSPKLPNVANAYIYNQTWNLIHSDYFSKNYSDSSLLYSSIKGMVASLNDPATLFLDPQDEKQFEETSSGNTFAGIGIELGYKDKNIIIERVLPSSPALTSGLKAGDTLISVDGTQVTGMDITDVADKIRGKQGSNVSLVIEHVGSSDTIKFSITREPIHVDSMYVQQETASDGKKIDDFVVSRFTEDTYTDWTNKWDQSMQQIVADKPDGLIIDLRDNPGGFLDAAVYGLSDFLPKNTVATMEENKDGSKTRFYTQNDPRIASNMKVTILVNESTASAAEIFSGAMQYYHRAQIIGVPTYGKGTAQKVYQFPDGSSLHLTVNHWLLPSGRWIQKTDPIHPDMQVSFSDTDFQNGNDPQLQKALDQY